MQPYREGLFQSFTEEHGRTQRGKHNTKCG